MKIVDVVVALNGELNQDGSLNEDTRRRVDSAIKYAADNQVTTLIMVGEDAAVMRDYAVSTGKTSNTSILVENRSHDTPSNAHYVKTSYLDPNKWRTIVVVTADWHSQRVRWTFKKVLGNAYSVTVISTKSPYSNSELLHLQRKDAILLLLSKAMLAGVSARNDKQRERRIKSLSPEYGGGSPLQRLMRSWDQRTHIRN